MRARMLTAALTAIATACGGPEEASSEGEAPAAADPSAMCTEHGVLEALCTRCNPALIPIFRARGDFCEEHELPESICPICHPERGGRPSQAIAPDEAPADGTRVRLASPQLAGRIGITVQAAVAAPEVAEVPATVRISYDPTRYARVNPRSEGVVRTIHADIGARVEEGTPLVTIASAEVGADRTRAAAARTRLEVAEAALARAGGLAGEGITSQRALLDARRERDEARAELSALQSSLRIVGSSRGSEYTLAAPIPGIVTQRAATIGTFVDSGATLFEIVDPSVVWAELDVPEDEIARIAPGQGVSLTVDALGDRAFSGTLAYLAPEIDPHTRTARGRVQLENADGALRAQMFGRALIQVPRAEPAVVVPSASIQRARGATLVFIRVADELYEARRVQVEEIAADPSRTEVRGRVAAGDQVVVQGAFLLRTETLRDSIGAGCCEGEE